MPAIEVDAAYLVHGSIDILISCCHSISDTSIFRLGLVASRRLTSLRPFPERLISSLCPGVTKRRIRTSVLAKPSAGTQRSLTCLFDALLRSLVGFLHFQASFPQFPCPDWKSGKLESTVLSNICGCYSAVAAGCFCR